jgi:hypothetical protein
MRRKSENAARQRGKAVVDERRMNDGTLERAEMDRLRNRAKRSVKSGDSRASAKRAALNTRAATHANAGDATGTVRSAGEAAIDATIAIIATTIDAVTPTGDRDATDATDATTSQYAETATAEASAERDATATDATRRDGGEEAVVAERDQKRDATIAIDASRATDARTHRFISMRIARAATKRAPTTVTTRKSTTTLRGRRQAATPTTKINPKKFR